MTYREETPVYNNSNTDLVAGSTTIEPYTTEMVDMSHPTVARNLRDHSHRWNHEPQGGPSGDPVITVGPVVDNRATVEVQFTSRQRKKWKKQSGIRVSFSDDALGTDPNTNATIVGLTLGQLVKPGLYKTTSDGRLTFVIENLVDEVVYVVLYLGCSKKAVSDAVDFSESVVLPTFSAFYSGDVYTLRLEGTGFATMQRILVSFTDGTHYVWNTGAPDGDNAGYQNTVTEWSDTAIQFSSPIIPVGTTVAVALENSGPAYLVVAEWENSSIAVGGFDPFAVATIPPKTLDAVHFSGGLLELTGTGFDNYVRVDIEFEDPSVQNIFLDYSLSSNWATEPTSTSIVVSSIGAHLLEWGAAYGSTHNIARVVLRTTTHAELDSIDDSQITGDTTFTEGVHPADITVNI